MSARSRNSTESHVRAVISRAISWPNSPKFVLDRIEAETPLGRMTEPEDVAGAVAYLASDDARS